MEKQSNSETHSVNLPPTQGEKYSPNIIRSLSWVMVKYLLAGWLEGSQLKWHLIIKKGARFGTKRQRRQRLKQHISYFIGFLLFTSSLSVFCTTFYVVIIVSNVVSQTPKIAYLISTQRLWFRMICQTSILCLHTPFYFMFLFLSLVIVLPSGSLRTKVAEWWLVTGRVRITWVM